MSPTPTPSRGRFPVRGSSWEGSACQTNPPSPGSMALLPMGATNQLLPLGEGAPLSSLAALSGSRGPLGQWNPPAPRCWALSDPTRWLWGCGEGPCPTQCLPSPRGKREAVPFQLTDSGKAGSPSRSVVSEPQSWDGQRQEGGVTPPSPPLGCSGAGSMSVVREGREGGRGQEQRSKT